MTALLRQLDIESFILTAQHMEWIDPHGIWIRSNFAMQFYQFLTHEWNGTVSSRNLEQASYLCLKNCSFNHTKEQIQLAEEEGLEDLVAMNEAAEEAFCDVIPPKPSDVAVRWHQGMFVNYCLYICSTDSHGTKTRPDKALHFGH